MRTSWHRLWGSATGPVRSLCPPTRLGAGLLVLAAYLSSPVPSVPGTLWALVVLGAWVVAIRPPLRLVGAGLLLGLALFLPYFLLVPWVSVPEGGGVREALAVPAAVIIRGIGGILICGATLASLTASDLREALVRLPIPAIVTAILLQIVHQAATLASETGAVAAAWNLRGATGRGRGAVALARALPRVWLPRVASRAERVGEAMAIRGYAEADPAPLRSCRPGGRDRVALGLAVLSLVVSLWIGGAR